MTAENLTLIIVQNERLNTNSAAVDLFLVETNGNRGKRQLHNDRKRIILRLDQALCIENQETTPEQSTNSLKLTENIFNIGPNSVERISTSWNF